MKKKHFTLLFIFTYFIVIGQNKFSVSGKVTIDNVIISNALIELNINKVHKVILSDHKGFYKYSNLISTDTIEINYKGLGFKSFYLLIKNINEDKVIDINISDVEALDEIVIKAKDKIINTSKKSSYKINSKDFIKNAKAAEVFNSIPNVFYNQDSGVKVDGNISTKIFIDGIEAMNNEINNIGADEIDRIEVINNPSQSYGSDYTGAVINIILKKKSQDFIKGSIVLNRSVSFDNWFVDPSISYKRKNLIFKSSFEYKTNNQKIENDLTRKNVNDVFFQNNINNTKGIQKSSETKFNIKLSSKSDISFSNSLFGYKFNGLVNGLSYRNNEIPINYSKNGENGNSEWNIGSVYKYSFKENKRIYLKGKYLVYKDFNKAKFIFDDNSSNFFDVESKNKDLYFAFDYESEELLLFKKKIGYYFGSKYINRFFSFSNTDYYVNQNVANFYSEIDIEWTSKFSSDLSITYEKTKNSNSISLNQSYDYVLPTFNSIYHFKNKFDARFGYSKKILRPSANDLNDLAIIINPGQGIQGNSNLLPQVRNYFFLTFNKVVNSNNFTLKIYNESINNSIVNTYKLDGDVLIQTLNNAAKYKSTGLNLGVRTKLFKKINTNFNTGFDYNIFKDNSQNALIALNKGYTFRGNINLSAKIFKDKYSISLSGSQNGPNYSLLSKTVRNPYLDFSLATNFFKDKINIFLYARNLLGTASNFEQQTSYSNFYQNSMIKNNSRNLSISITYNFGKKFNDKIDENGIDNSDIRK